MFRLWNYGIVFILLLVVLVGCSQEFESTAGTVGKAVGDQVNNILDRDNPYVLSVKNGYPFDRPDQLYGETFEKFFGTPTWKYFRADSGEDVVEFTGYMVYQDTDVKARIQFILDDGTFEVGALSFNDVPQNELIKQALLDTVFQN